MSEPWPAGLTDSLWSYRLLASEERPYLPMMGVDFTPGFLWAFGFGAAFIMVSAWNRFNTPQTGAGKGFALLNDIDGNDLGGRTAMVRAYLIYAFALLSVFVAMTFFGKLILETAQAVPLAGIAVDTSTLKFDSPQWPLMLAFGFAGLAPLLPPLELAEKWLRDRAFRAVGIPVRIEQTARSVITSLEEACRTARKGAAPDALRDALARHKSNIIRAINESDWASDLLKTRRARRRALVNGCAQVELLVEWAKTARGVWPGPEVSQKLRQTEEAVVVKADRLLSDFGARLAKAGPAPSSGAAAPNADPADAELDKAIGEVRAVRDDLAVLLAIYMECDPDDPARATKKHDKALAELLKRSETLDDAGVGPEAGVLVCMPIVFLAYLLAAWKGYHSLVVAAAPTSDLRTVLMTAGVETLRQVSIVWLPLLLAFSLRQYVADNRNWAKRFSTDPSRYLSQRVAAIFLAAAGSAIGLCGVAMLHAFGAAESSDRFRELLFGGASPFILYYGSQVILSIAVVAGSLAAADSRARGRHGLVPAAVSAVAVFWLIVIHYRFWGPSAPACVKDATYPFDLFTQGRFKECARLYNALDLFVLPLLAFLSAAAFGVHDRARDARPRRRRIWKHFRLGAAAAGSLAVVLLSALAARGAETGRRPIVIGFREDAEPFSYVESGADPAEPPHFEGYLADLCYQIFADGPYDVNTTLVTAQNRFARMRQENGETGKIDVLCDPVTMRFSDPRRRDVGVFSPTVFASGVSYFEKSARNNLVTPRGDLFIGYVAGTTSADVARRACIVDLFRRIRPEQKAGLYERCEAAALLARAHTIALSIEEDIRNAWSGAPSDLERQSETHREEIRERYEPKIKYSKILINNIITDFNKLNYSVNITETYKYYDSVYWFDIRRRLAKFRFFLEKARIPDSPQFSADFLRKLSAVSGDLSDCNGRDYRLPAEGAPPQRINIHLCAMPSHNDLIQWFCGPESLGRRLVYMGDRELIRGKLATWEAHGDSCNVERAEGADSVTYEPYALLVTKTNPELIQFVQRRVYEIFSHRDGANSLFAKHFPGRSMSPALAYLFLLNAVEDEKNLGPGLPRGAP